MAYRNTIKAQNQLALIIVKGWLYEQKELNLKNTYIKKALDLLNYTPKGYKKYISITEKKNNIIVSIATPDCSDILLFIGYVTYNPSKTQIRLKENNYTIRPVLGL